MVARVIFITGTPGTGKTTVSKKLSEKLGIPLIGINEFSFKHCFNYEYDEERETWLIDYEKLKNSLNNFLKNKEGTYIIEGHFSDLIDPLMVDVVIILRCSPKVLYERLKKKGWSEKKIRENVQSEILGVCTYDAANFYPKDKIFELDTTNRKVDEVVSNIMKIIKSKKKEDFKLGSIDWLTEENIKLFFD
ncbi:MAG: adenylate kinase family protein [Candidatus Odinarchaeota archaeon]|nr:adenylate kinase family protein [Candidatus Odinarchaeota archaeon]